MKKKILLVQPSIDTCYEYISSLGLINLYLIAKKYCNVDFLDETRVPLKKSIQKICSKKYDIIGVSANFTNAIPACIQYGRQIKTVYPDTILIAGGNHSTFSPEDLLFNGYDFVFLSEAEQTFEIFLNEYIKYGADYDRLSKIAGLAYLQNNVVYKNRLMPLIENIDELPLLDFSDEKLNLIFNNYFEFSGMRYITMETSRGCIHNCNFCSTVKMWQNKYRFKSPDRVLKEFIEAKKNNIESILIVDDDFALNEKNAQLICEKIIENKIYIPWSTTIGINSIKDEHTYRLMKKAGCEIINICIETASDRLLKEYKKPFRLKHFYATVNNIKNSGIKIHNHGIVGSATEKISETIKTFYLLFKTSELWHVSILEPRPGAEIIKSLPKDKIYILKKFERFSKANIFFSDNIFKTITIYFLYRFFVFLYLINPAHWLRAFFCKNKLVRYNYRIQYYIAMKVIFENIKNALKIKK
ncbi:MAG TPA: radical SAM protein [bacterium]|nr:radical SAM protein [bacterium]